ncbi:unnamed protein product [marine sediment metagenome]|uniref:Uncharacterized protein n=1 Tax=marine sediment metagenome TaxID=412755 RepID=X1IH59_9ZZZZ
MRWHIDLKGWRLYIGISHSVKVKGVNSNLPDGRHILMWDFDNVEGEDVINQLLYVQDRFKLSRIFLLNTGLDGHWHAYCFKAKSWANLLHILASTEGLDQTFFKIGIIRGFFTLRYSKKEGRGFIPAIILPSRVQEDIDPFEDLVGCEFWTKRL